MTDDETGLLPIGPHDHPEPQTMVWTGLELRAIRAYAARCVAARQAADAQQADAELARLRAECADLRDGINVARSALALVQAECDRLRAEAAKSERRAIAFGDIVQAHVIAMRAAVVAAKLEGLDVGMQWIANTLCGPGHLPDLDEARALGGAQALWDKETAEHEAFRAAHPGPGAAT